MSTCPPSPQAEARKSPRARRAPRGFTLIELMLVVVIIGVLSTFALPYFQRVTARARRTEAQMVLEKLHVHFINTFESTGSYLDGFTTSGYNPPIGGSNPAVGQPAPWSTAVSGWQQVPFAFDGGLKLRYRYDVATDGQSMTLTVVGDMPGLGAAISGLPGGITGNYLLVETLQGPTITQVEIPAM